MKALQDKILKLEQENMYIRNKLEALKSFKDKEIFKYENKIIEIHNKYN
jgi:hypothetical protein